MNRCDSCDKTKCIIATDPVEAKAKVMHCRKEWDRMDVNEYLRQNGWTKHDIAWFWDEDLTEDREEDREEDCD